MHERIDDGTRPKLLFRQIRVGVGGKRHRESFHPSGFDREPGRGPVPPEPDQLLGAGGEAAMQVEAPGGSARAFPFALPARDQHNRPVIALDQPGGHDSDHALVPLLAREHIAPPPLFRLRPGLDLVDRLAEDSLLDRLAVAVELVETMGQPGRLVSIFRQQQLERRLGVAEPAGRVQPRGEPEADGGGIGDGRVDAGDLHQLS